MTDKMIRISGRNQSGVAKPFSINGEDLKVYDINAASQQAELVRAAKISNGVIEDIFDEGVEKNTMVYAHSLGKGSVNKKEDRIEMILSGNTTSIASRTIRTEHPVDLSNADWVYIEFTLAGTSPYNTFVHFGIADHELTNEQSLVKKELINVDHGNKDKRIARLNVADIKDGKFIRVHLTDSSTELDVPATMNIFRIWTETNQSKKDDEIKNEMLEEREFMRRNKNERIIDSYFYGQEMNDLSIQEIGNVSYHKGEKYIEFSISDNTDMAEIGVKTTEPVTNKNDNIDYVEVEYSLENLSKYKARVMFEIRDTPEFVEGVTNRVLLFDLIDKGKNINRYIKNIKLPETLKGKELYYSVIFEDSSTAVPVNFNAKLHRVSFVDSVGNINKQFTAIDAESGDITQPTTIKDPNGKDALRIVDAAPFAYDEVNDTKKIALRKSVQVSDTVSSDVVKPSAGKEILVSPDTYTIGEIKDFGMNFPAIAESTGTHSVDIAVGDIGGYRARRVYSVNKNSSEAISIDFENNLKELLKGIVFSPELPLTILYRNHSNLDQTGYKSVYVLYVQEVVSL